MRPAPGAPGRARVRAGFTLLELLVALAVFALAAAAILNLSAENSRLAQHLHTRAMAGIVANNLAVEATVAPLPPAAGSGTAALAGQTWAWTRTTTPTDDAALVRIDIQVSEPEAADGAVAASLTLFRDAAP